MRRHSRGFTLIEVTIALTLLVTVLAASWTLLSGAQRNERMLWDEFSANELAVSQLERATSSRTLEITPVAGSPVEIADANPDLPQVTMTQFVTAVDERPELVDVRVLIAWNDAATHSSRSLERTMRMRISR